MASVSARLSLLPIVCLDVCPLSTKLIVLYRDFYGLPGLPPHPPNPGRKALNVLALQQQIHIVVLLRQLLVAGNTMYIRMARSTKPGHLIQLPLPVPATFHGFGVDLSRYEVMVRQWEMLPVTYLASRWSRGSYCGCVFRRRSNSSGYVAGYDWLKETFEI